jgi:hypothetical protein
MCSEILKKKTRKEIKVTEVQELQEAGIIHWAEGAAKGVGFSEPTSFANGSSEVVTDLWGREIFVWFWYYRRLETEAQVLVGNTVRLVLITERKEAGHLVYRPTPVDPRTVSFKKAKLWVHSSRPRL